MTSLPHDLPRHESRPVSLENASYHAYRILQFVFVVAPILAGLDKFFYMLADWDKYLAPWAARMVGGNTHAFMMFVGVVEIVAGIGVAIKPKYFAYIVALWLFMIIVNLLSHQAYYDIALRDLGLALAAIGLGRLAAFYDRLPWGGLLAHHHTK